ncbi:hypothetical protein SOASR030_01090 [Leminorella grimontii]|uniref:Uncharacterized protein n=1 Tax=Leminorella grimontii TaxID=82981 RepID=A0AAV5N025_9GAMM|nr:hypothetical protein SOASR030_01090 [Leminorella grimontii]GKX60251.1 hypothetical protein SOASR031_25660 [Leminorella grimontii]
MTKPGQYNITPDSPVHFSAKDGEMSTPPGRCGDIIVEEKVIVPESTTKSPSIELS